jgi:hypothetical protein
MSAPTDTWRVWVTEDDLREARAAWARARDAGAPADRVGDLREELERLSRTAAYQATGDAWDNGRGLDVVRRMPSLAARRLLRPDAQLSAAG